MKKTIRKAAVFESYDFDYKESWLNKMAAEGYLLEKDGMFVCRFEASDNRNRRYCILPKEPAEFAAEELALYEEQGWFLFPGGTSTSIFYTDEPEAPDLFTDEESYKTYLTKSLRRFRRNSIGCLAVGLLWGLNLYLSMPGRQTSLLGLTERTLWSEICYIMLLVLVVGFQIVQGIAMLRARSRILRGEKRICRTGTYRLKKLTSLVTTVLIIIMLGAMVGSIPNWNAMDIDDAMVYEGESPVMLRAFSPEEWDFVSANTGVMAAEEKAVRYDYELQHVSNLTLREGWQESIEWREQTGYDDWELPEYTSLTYDFRKEETAQKMLLKEIGIDANQSTNLLLAEKSAAEIEIPVSMAEIDYAGYIDGRNDDGWQFLYLRSGTKVVYASYCGEADLLDALPLFEKQLL